MPSVLNWRIRYALRALLHRAGDLLHFLGALAGGENLLDQSTGEAERDERDDRGDDHQVKFSPAKDSSPAAR